MENNFYQKISVEKELPEEDERYYLTDQGWQYFHCGNGFENKLEYWLKPCPIEEWMVEFARQTHFEDRVIDLNYVKEFLKTKNYV